MEKIYLDNANADDRCVTVQIIGSSLVACAMESLIAGQPGYAVVRDAGQIVLLIGANGLSIAKKLKMHKSRRRRERFVLIGDGSPIDFGLVRDIPVNIFIAADESVSVLLEALSAAANGYAFCSAQMVPILVESTRGRDSTQGLDGDASAPAILRLPDAAREARTQLVKTSQSARGRSSARNTTPFRAPSEVVEGAGRVATALGLTEREWEVASLAVEGLTNIEIGEKTAMSVPSVKFLLYRAYQKLGIRRRAQLASALMIVPAESLTFATGRKQSMARHHLRLEAIRAAS